MNPLEVIWGRFYWKILWIFFVLFLLLGFKCIRPGYLSSDELLLYLCVSSLLSACVFLSHGFTQVSYWMPNFSAVMRRSLLHAFVMYSLGIVLLVWSLSLIPKHTNVLLVVFAMSVALQFAFAPICWLFGNLRPLLMCLMIMAVSQILRLDTNLISGSVREVFSGRVGLGLLLASMLVVAVAYQNLPKWLFKIRLDASYIPASQFFAPKMEELIIRTSTSPRRARIVGEVFGAVPYLFSWWTYLFLVSASLLLFIGSAWIKEHAEYDSFWIIGWLFILPMMGGDRGFSSATHSGALIVPSSRGILLSERLISSLLSSIGKTAIFMLIYGWVVLLSGRPSNLGTIACMLLFLEPVMNLACLLGTMEPEGKRSLFTENLMLIFSSGFVLRTLSICALMTWLLVVVAWMSYEDNPIILLANTPLAWILYYLGMSHMLQHGDLWLRRRSSALR